MKQLVLVGGGHAHVQVLKDWVSAPIAGVELTVVSPSAWAPYSGMVPGWLAGIYDFETISMDVAALAHAAHARWVEGEVISLDAQQQALHLAGGTSMHYDLLSLNIGSTLHPPADKPGHWLCMRPLGELNTRWTRLLSQLAPDQMKHRRVIAAGGGPAGVEVLLAVLTRLRAHQPKSTFEGLLITRDSSILREHAPGAKRSMLRELRQAKAQVLYNTDASTFETQADDILLWATGAQAHAWPSASALAVDSNGFVMIDEQLCSTSHANVYAVGDCAAWQTPLPKAGVIAVRMGPTLVHNLRASLLGATGRAYRPQRTHLALLATGHRTAVASWNQWSAQGAWVWRWKDHIDRAFLTRFGVAK